MVPSHILLKEDDDDTLAVLEKLHGPGSRRARCLCRARPRRGAGVARGQAQHRHLLGRRRRAVQHQRLLARVDGLQDAQHRPDREGRHDVHGLLRRAELHGASFITGQSGLRTGLTKVGLPGATLGLRKEDPTIAEMLKPLGYYRPVREEPPG